MIEKPGNIPIAERRSKFSKFLDKGSMDGTIELKRKR